MISLFIIIVSAFAFASLASYFTVLVMRGEKLTQANGSRSECDHCFHTLAWYELIPVISYLLNRGRCRYCAVAIDKRMFVAEFFAAVFGSVFGLFLTQSLVLPLNPFNVIEILVVLIVGAILLYLSIFDMLTYTVPTMQLKWALGIAVAGNILFAVLNYLHIYSSNILGNLTNLIAAVVAGLFLTVLIVLTKNKGMGQGDVLIAAIIGMVLGLTGLLAGFYVMLLSASIFGIAYSLKLNKFKGLLIPLVPFMTFGFFVALTWGPKIVNILFPTF